MTEIRKTLSGPKTQFESNEDGDGFDPNTQSVGWAIGWDCQLTFGMEEDGLQFTLAISGDTQARGVEVRTVTSEQVRGYAAKLLALADAWDAAQLRRSVGCDLSPTCVATQHVLRCLGLYRTEEEVARSFFPAASVLSERRSNEQFHRAYTRAGGGGPDAA
jgi:hypothetical protein